MRGIFYNDLVYFTAQVQDTSDTSATQRTQVRQQCYKNDMSATPVKNFDFNTARVKTYFYTPFLTIWQMNFYKESATKQSTKNQKSQYK